MMELLVAVAVFGMVSLAFLSALTTGYRGVMVAQDQTTAESLTRTALEDTRQLGFADISTTTENITTVSPYEVVVHADYVDDDSYTVITGPSNIKLITVTVRHEATDKTIKVTTVTRVQ